MMPFRNEATMKKEEFNLKDYLPYFTKVGESRFGLIVDFDSLEKAFVPLRTKKEQFSAKHLDLLQKDYAFMKWWKIPSLDQGEYNEIQDAIASLKPRDKEGIFCIYDKIKNIEVVSCMLRVIDPDNYAVMTPPVENLLNSQGRHQVDKYMNFLGDLEDLKEVYEFTRIADVDKALWTMANIINDSSLRYSSEEYRDLYDMYQDSINRVKVIKAKNAFKPILEDKSSYLDFAMQFIEVDYELAGIFAGKEFESLIKRMCEDNDIKTKWRGTGEHKKMYVLINKLVEKRVIRPSDVAVFDGWWKTRNESVHEDNFFKDDEELRALKLKIAVMIDGLRKLRSEYKEPRSN